MSPNAQKSAIIRMAEKRGMTISATLLNRVERIEDDLPLEDIELGQLDQGVLDAFAYMDKINSAPFDRYNADTVALRERVHALEQEAKTRETKVAALIKAAENMLLCADKGDLDSLANASQDIRAALFNLQA